MSFIQNLFTSRDNNANGNSYVGQQDRIWWNPNTNAFYYSDGNTAGGILITGGVSGNGLPGGAANSVQYNASGNFAGDPNFVFNSATSTLTITNIVANTITGGAGGTNTQVQFNTNGNLTGNSNFTYNSATRAMIMTGTASLGNVYPTSNNTSNIGTPNNRFYDLWLGSGNINLIDHTLNTNQEINAADGNLIISGGNGLKFGQFAIYGNTISTINPTANINIGLAGSTGYVDIERPVAINSTGGGLPAFVVEQNGTVAIFNSNAAANTAGALNIVGSTARTYQNVTNSGGMIHITGPDNSAARITVDAFGVGATAAFVGRVGRGNASAPSAVQANDVMVRIGAVGWATTGFTAPSPSATTIEVVALENFTDAAQGTKITFNTANTGSNSRSVSATIQANGVSFLNNTTANSGITFRDGSYQNTAYLSTSVVRSLTAGSGISLSSNVGNVTITNTGVLGIVGTVNQISITGNVGNVVTLGTPQDLAPTSNVQFNNLTVNNLSILGNVSNTIPVTVSGPVIYVANTATTYADINNSGLSTGNVSNNYYASILYSTTNNTWRTNIGNSVGITAGNVYATQIVANGAAHLGNASNNYDFPNALLQGDIDIDSYAQYVLKNYSQTANASADIVAVANNGDDGSYYIDMGINSNVYANVDYAVTGANDGYLYVNGGNLVIGTQTAGKYINFFTGGTGSTTKIRGTINDSGLSMVGNVTANNVIGATAAIGGIVTATGNITGGNLLAPAGIISASGNITGLNVNTGIVSATGNIRGGNINTTGLVSTAGNIQAGNLLTTGLISSTGNIAAANIAAGNITSAIISATGNITGPNITATLLSISSTASITGNLQGGNLLTDGLISTTGNVTSSYFLGNGRFLTGLPVSTFIANGTSQVNIPLASSNANITIGATSNVAVFATTGAYITGLASVTSNVISNNVVATTIVNAASHTGGLVSVTGNITAAGGVFGAGNISTTGNIQGGNFVGAVAATTVSASGNVTANNVVATTIVNTASFTGGLVSVTGNVTANNVIATTTVNTASFTGGTVSVTGNVTANNGIFTTTVNTASFTGSTVSVTGNVTGNFFVGNGSALTGIVSSYGNANVVANLAALGSNPVSTTGNITANNGIFTTIVNTASFTGGLVSVTGNVTAAGGTFGSGNISTTGNIQGGNFVGAVAATTVSASGNVTANNGMFTNIVNVASLTGGLVSVTGNVISNNVIATTIVNAASHTGGLVSVTGNVTANFFVGNGSALTGIVSSYGNANVVANLAALGSNPVSTTGNVTANNLIATTTVNTASFTGGSVSVTGNVTAAGGTFGSGNISTTGNIQGGNFVGAVTATSVSASGNIAANPASFFIGNGRQLTGIVASTTFPLANGTSNINAPVNGNISINVGGTANVAVFAATGEFITGLISSTGNIVASNVITGGGATLINTAISTTGNVTGAWLIASNGNTLIDNGVSTTGNVTGAYILGNIANATGGPAAQIISTWVPTLAATGGGSFTYSTQLGNYVKSGRSVTLYFTIVISGVTGVSGTVSVSGFPAVAANTSGAQGGGALDNYIFAAMPTHVTGIVPSAASEMNLYWHNRSGSTNTMALMTTGDLGTSATLTGRITYISGI